jgi:hypothetical protein
LPNPTCTLATILFKFFNFAALSGWHGAILPDNGADVA